MPHRELQPAEPYRSPNWGVIGWVAEELAVRPLEIRSVFRHACWVSTLGRPPLPAEIVRDLLAIARALHASRKAEGAKAAELRKLAAASTALTNSLNMAHAEEGTIGRRAAWGWAERGLTLLAEALCREDAAAQLFVAAWGARLLKGPGR